MTPSDTPSCETAIAPSGAVLALVPPARSRPIGFRRAGTDRLSILGEDGSASPFRAHPAALDQAVANGRLLVVEVDKDPQRESWIRLEDSSL